MGVGFIQKKGLIVYHPVKSLSNAQREIEKWRETIKVQLYQLMTANINITKALQPKKSNPVSPTTTNNGLQPMILSALKASKIQQRLTLYNQI